MRERLMINGELVDVSVTENSGSATVKIGDREHAVSGVMRENGALRFNFGGRMYRFHVLPGVDKVQVTDGRAYYKFAKIEEGAPIDEEPAAAELTSQMPGTVLKLLVEPGAEVAKGTPLLILEAMKMEHEFCAPADGTVAGFPHAAGERVMPGDLLVDFEAAE
jgi:3-methylcrotonyl-CoA carboxylase alpha subunit